MTNKEVQIIQKGSVVYFITNDLVTAGIFDEAVNDGKEVYVDCIEPVKHIFVNNIALEDFSSEKTWKPLPKDWKYDTKLFTYENRLTEFERQRLQEIKIDNPSDILRGLQEGLIVLSKNVYHGEVKAEIDNHKGWRIVKSYPNWVITYGASTNIYQKIACNDLFLTYQEANRHLTEIRETKQRLAEMSDEDWSRNEIEKVLSRFDSDKANKYREILFRLPNIANIEVRKYSDILQWRYFERKTNWIPVE